MGVWGNRARQQWGHGKGEGGERGRKGKNPSAAGDQQSDRCHSSSGGVVVVVSNSVAVVVAVRVVVVYRGCNCLARFGAVFAKKVLPETRNQRVPVKLSGFGFDRACT